MLNPEPVHFPQVTQTFLKGISEVIGPEDLRDAMEQAGMVDANPDGSFSFSDMDGLRDAFIGLFGERACRGVMQRSGRASFLYFLREFGQSLGLTTLEYRLLTNPQRLRVGLEKLAQFFSDHCKIKVRLDQDDRRWYWKMKASQTGAGCKSEEIFCQFSIGFLQDFLIWCGNDQNYRVSEVKLQENGESYNMVRIDKITTE